MRRGEGHHPDHLSLLLPVHSRRNTGSKVGAGVKEMCLPALGSAPAPQQSGSLLEGVEKMSSELAKFAQVGSSILGLKRYLQLGISMVTRLT